MTLVLSTFPAGPLDCTCAIVGDRVAKEAVLIDPGGEPERIAAVLAQHDLRVVAIVHTHGHLDHMLATAAVKAAHGGIVCLHGADAWLHQEFQDRTKSFLGLDVSPAPPLERLLEHEDVIDCGAYLSLSQNDRLRTGENSGRFSGVASSSVGGHGHVRRSREVE